MSPAEVISSDVNGETSPNMPQTTKFDKKDQETPSTPVTEAPPLEGVGEKSHLPTGSVSSVELSESTKKLINSLSMQGLSGALPAEDDKEAAPQTSGLTVQPIDLGASTPATDVSAVQSPLSDTFPTTQRLPKQDKKPVKFTVRKVSRDTINTSGNSSNGQRQYSYGNLPQNQEPKERKPLTKNEQLQRSQSKYDLYAVRVEKINKEIDFLTNLLPPYNVEIDYATRNKIARAIEKLKMKQDEIQKKKYSLGITLSRLWREHDERELWVRSVSNQ